VGSLCAVAEAMTPCTRGVSDLGCGRGHDRRRRQISWSLTPRRHSLAPSRRWWSLAVGKERRPTDQDKKLPGHIDLETDTKENETPA